MAPQRYDMLIKAVLIVGLGALALLPVGALGAKFGFWGFGRGFQFMFTGAFVAAAVVVLGLAVLVFALRAGRKDAVVPIGIGLVASVVALAVLGSQYRLTTTVPPINDITTDLDDPPAFAALELRGGQPLEYVVEKGAPQQQSYAHIETEASDLPPPEALAKALAVAEDLGWEVVADGAVADTDDLTIEAKATTFWFGFVDDVVVRIRPNAAGSLVDVRSASRVGMSDLGANAARIDAFIERFRGS